MPKIKYRDNRINPGTLKMIATANVIVEDYVAQGFDLTLRQLYYQLVSKAIIPNSEKSYKNLGETINKARLAGLIDWNHIVDRTRNVRVVSTWEDPSKIINATARGYRTDKWKNQDYHVECWIEKDALVGVIEGVCHEMEINHFSCRGYTSQSEMWGAAQRLLYYANAGKVPVILHLGDHDPSGCDMTRDIDDRLAMFMGGTKVERLALNMDQVRKFNPPPNPAKFTDSRCENYVREHGNESWELDALTPQVLADLIRKNTLLYRDEEKWQDDLAEQEQERLLLTQVSKNWKRVPEALDIHERVSQMPPVVTAVRHHVRQATEGD